jgi:hypothetical protein
MTAASFGTMPTISVRHLILPLRRAIGLLASILARQRSRSCSPSLNVANARHKGGMTREQTKALVAREGPGRQTLKLIEVIDESGPSLKIDLVHRGSAAPCMWTIAASASASDPG